MRHFDVVPDPVKLPGDVYVVPAGLPSTTSTAEVKESKMTKVWVQAYTSSEEDPDNSQWLFVIGRSRKAIGATTAVWAESDELLGSSFQVELPEIDFSESKTGDYFNHVDLTTDQVDAVIAELESRLEPAAAPGVLKKTWDRTKKQGGQIASAAVLGAQLAIVNQAGEALLDVAREFGKDIPLMALLLEHPEGREVAKLLAALSIHTLATHAPGVVPAAPHVLRAAQLSMTASSFQLLTPRLVTLRKHMLSLASIGEQLGDAELPENPLNALTEGAERLNGSRARDRVKVSSE